MNFFLLGMTVLFFLGAFLFTLILFANLHNGISNTRFDWFLSIAYWLATLVFALEYCDII